jgi:hypothetical protein
MEMPEVGFDFGTKPATMISNAIPKCESSAGNHVQAFFPKGSNTVLHLSSGGQYGYWNALV